MLKRIANAALDAAFQGLWLWIGGSVLAGAGTLLAYVSGIRGGWIVVGASVAGTLIVMLGVVAAVALRDLRIRSVAVPEPRERRYLQMDAPHYVAHAELRSAGAPPVAPPGRVIVDVTERPEAQMGDVYSPATGLFERPYDLRVETARAILREAARHFQQMTEEDLKRDPGTFGFRYVRVKGFIQEAFVADVVAEIEGREKAQRLKDRPAERNIREFGRQLEALADRLSPSLIDADYAPASFDSLLRPRP